MGKVNILLNCSQITCKLAYEIQSILSGNDKVQPLEY